MLVHYFGYIDGGLEEVAAALDGATGEMSAWARIAYRRGEALRTSIGPGASAPAKEVELTVGGPVRRAGLILIPLVWEATGPGGLFPVMNADLVLEPVGEQVVQVTLRGTYSPPLKGVGRLIDRALMHRFAEACTKSFLDQLCAATQAEIDAAAGRVGSDREHDPDRGPHPDAGSHDELAAGVLGATPETGKP